MQQWFIKKNLQNQNVSVFFFQNIKTYFWFMSEKQLTVKYKTLTISDPFQYFLSPAILWLKYG